MMQFTSCAARHLSTGLFCLTVSGFALGQPMRLDQISGGGEQVVVPCQVDRQTPEGPTRQSPRVVERICSGGAVSLQSSGETHHPLRTPVGVVIQALDVSTVVRWSPSGEAIFVADSSQRVPALSSAGPAVEIPTSPPNLPGTGPVPSLTSASAINTPSVDTAVPPLLPPEAPSPAGSQGVFIDLRALFTPPSTLVGR